jgi:RND family efflux transporter MFP subunit
MRKVIVWAVILVLLAGAGYGFYLWRQRQREAQVSSLQTTPAEEGSLTATIGATGQVRSKQSALLSWKTSGTIRSIFFGIGETVKAGEKLAELEQTSLPQNVILAQAELESAKKALDDLYTNAENAKVQALQSIANHAKAVRNAQYQLDNFTVPETQSGLGTMDALDAMKEKLDAARSAFEPYKYYPSGDSSREDLKEKLDEAQADYNAAVKRLEYEYALEVATANLDKARADYEKWKDGPSTDEVAAAEARIAAARATLSQTWIEAPFEGTITLALPQIGDQVNLNTNAFRLDDLSSLLVDLAVSEVDINEIQEGQEVTLTFDAIRGTEYHGKVIEVDQVGTSNQGVVDFTVTVELMDPDEQVKPGMTAAVNIVVEELVDVLLVPNRAVRFKDGRQVVYLLKDNQAVPVEIRLGASSETVSQVLEGELKVGDPIILNPPQEFESNGPPPFVRRGGG